MTVLCGGYQGATVCSSGPSTGARGAMAWYLGAYGEEGGKNLGIFNCRPVRGSTSTTSLHGEGRADDFGTPRVNSWSWDLAELIRLHSAELGVQCIIHRRKIASSSYCTRGWRDYDGIADHFDHLHVELTKEAAKRSEADTIALWNRVLGDPSPIRGDGHVINPPVPPDDFGKQVVRSLQQILHFDPARGEVDGVWGRQTDAGLNTIRAAINGRFDLPGGVKEAQTRVGAKADGAWGSLSRAALKNTVKRLQTLWGVGVDGVWGANTQRAYERDRAAYFRG